MALINVEGRKPRISSSDGHSYTTPGKETPPLPQRKGERMKEKEFNEAVQNYFHEELVRCGFDHKDVAPGKSDVPLAIRSKASNDFKADLHIDIHANAFDGILNDKAGGIETLYNEKSSHAKKVAEVIHRHIMQGTKMKDRGLKPGAWLHMVNSVKCVSILVELGFMDNKYDVDKLLSDDYRKECAVELAKACCEIFGMAYVPKPAPKPATKPATKPAEKTSGNFFRVVTGSFGSKPNAVDRMKAIKAKGFESFLITEKVDGKTTYRVITGSFGTRENAQERANTLKKAGFDSFLAVYKK